MINPYAMNENVLSINSLQVLFPVNSRLGGESPKVIQNPLVRGRSGWSSVPAGSALLLGANGYRARMQNSSSHASDSDNAELSSDPRTAGPVSLANIGDHQCRYILGEPIKQLCCGRPARGSWCADHAAEVYEAKKNCPPHKEPLSARVK